MPILRKFAHTLQSYRTGLLNYYRHRITTAAWEGTNNKIRTMQRQAYGFRLKIFALHEANYAFSRMNLKISPYRRGVVAVTRCSYCACIFMLRGWPEGP